MVDEASGAEEQQSRFRAAEFDNSEVMTCCDSPLLLFFCQGGQNSAKILDDPFLDRLMCCDAGFRGT